MNEEDIDEMFAEVERRKSSPLLPGVNLGDLRDLGQQVRGDRQEAKQGPLRNAKDYKGNEPINHANP